MECAEAEAIYDRGREVVVEVLLRMDRQIQELGVQVARQEVLIAKQGERVAQLERRLNPSWRNSSQPSSADGPSAPGAGQGLFGASSGRVARHEGKGQPLLPAWAVDEAIEH